LIFFSLSWEWVTIFFFFQKNLTSFSADVSIQDQQRFTQPPPVNRPKVNAVPTIHKPPPTLPKTNLSTISCNILNEKSPKEISKVKSNTFTKPLSNVQHRGEASSSGLKPDNDRNKNRITSNQSEYKFVHRQTYRMPDSYFKPVSDKEDYLEHINGNK
jgi:hypothetical protein